MAEPTISELEQILGNPQTLPFAGAPTADRIIVETALENFVRYSARFDSYFSADRNQWLDPLCACGDPGCPHTGRPETPLDCCPADLDC